MSIWPAQWVSSQFKAKKAAIIPSAHFIPIARPGGCLPKNGHANHAWFMRLAESDNYNFLVMENNLQGCVADVGKGFIVSNVANAPRRRFVHVVSAETFSEKQD